MAGLGRAAPMPLPLSPCSSQTPPPSAFLEDNPDNPMDTQPALDFSDLCGLSPAYLADWAARYNRRTIPVMSDLAFESLVAEVVNEGKSVGLDAVEREVSRRIREETKQLERDMDSASYAFLYSDVPVSDAAMLSAGDDSVRGQAEFKIAAMARLTQLLSSPASAATPRKTATKVEPKAARRGQPQVPARTASRTDASRTSGAGLRRSGRIEKKRKTPKRPS